MLRPYLELPRQVHVLCLGTLINRAGTLLLPFLTLYLTEQLEYPESFATLTLGAFGLGAMGAGLFGGHFADVIGRRTTMLGSLLGGACVLFVFGFLRTPWVIYGAVLLFAFLGEMYRPAASAMIADLVEPERRAFAYGLMYVAVNLGCSIGPVIGGLMAEHSYQWLFWADGGTAILYAILIALVVRETLPSKVGVIMDAAEERTGPRVRGPMPPGGPVPPGAPPPSLIEAARHIRRDYRFLLFCFGTLLIGIVIMQCVSTFPLHLTSLGFSKWDYGRIVAINAIMIVVLQIPLNTVLTRFHRGRVLALGALLTAVGFGMIGLGRTRFDFAMAVVVFTFGEMMQAPMIPSIVGDFAPANLRGRYMGMVGICFSGATAFGVPLGGIVLDRFGPGALWGGCLVVGMAATAVFLSILKHTKRRPAAGTCGDCGYSLTGSAADRCPECGTAV